LCCATIPREEEKKKETDRQTNETDETNRQTKRKCATEASYRWTEEKKEKRNRDTRWKKDFT
jgi:hypothetical protein